MLQNDVESKVSLFYSGNYPFKFWHKIALKFNFIYLILSFLISLFLILGTPFFALIFKFVGVIIFLISIFLFLIKGNVWLTFSYIVIQYRISTYSLTSKDVEKLIYWDGNNIEDRDIKKQLEFINFLNLSFSTAREVNWRQTELDPQLIDFLSNDNFFKNNLVDSKPKFLFGEIINDQVFFFLKEIKSELSFKNKTNAKLVNNFFEKNNIKIWYNLSGIKNILLFDNKI